MRELLERLCALNAVSSWEDEVRAFLLAEEDKEERLLSLMQLCRNRERSIELPASAASLHIHKSYLYTAFCCPRATQHDADEVHCQLRIQELLILLLNIYLNYEVKLLHQLRRYLC